MFIEFPYPTHTMYHVRHTRTPKKAYARIHKYELLRLFRSLHLTIVQFKIQIKRVIIQIRRNVSHARVYIRIQHSVLQNYYVPNVHTRTRRTHIVWKQAATGRNAMKWKHNKTHHITCSHLSQSKLTLCIYVSSRAGVHLCSRSVPHTHRHVCVCCRMEQRKNETTGVCIWYVLLVIIAQQRDDSIVECITWTWTRHSTPGFARFPSRSLFRTVCRFSLFTLSSALSRSSLAQDTQTNKQTANVFMCMRSVCKRCKIIWFFFFASSLDWMFVAFDAEHTFGVLTSRDGNLEKENFDSSETMRETRMNFWRKFDLFNWWIILICEWASEWVCVCVISFYIITRMWDVMRCDVCAGLCLKRKRQSEMGIAKSNKRWDGDRESRGTSMYWETIYAHINPYFPTDFSAVLCMHITTARVHTHAHIHTSCFLFLLRLLFLFLLCCSWDAIVALVCT